VVCDLKIFGWVFHINDLKGCVMTRLLTLFFISFLCWAENVAAQEFVVFKVHTPFDMGQVMPDSGRVNDFYIRVGLQEGAQIGTVLNVYRDREIVADIGTFRVTDRHYIGRMRVITTNQEYSVSRVVDLANFSDPHRVLNAVVIGDYVQPVFVVSSENLFEQGSGSLRPEGQTEIARAALFIARFQPIKVRVEGHTDNTGDEDANMTLSQARAEAVMRTLIDDHGIDEEILVPVGYGEGKPLAPNDTPEGQRKNRRFEIVIEK
jgi:outer membrane protein OmpA-like peptidoglycan-associated protein